MADSLEALKDITEALIDKCEKLDLIINQSKTKSMMFGTSAQLKDRTIDIKIKGVDIEMVSEFKYLGVMLESTMSSEIHVKKRLDNFYKGFYGIGGIGISSGLLNARLRAFLLNTYCLPILTYGLEVVHLNVQQTEKIKRAFTITLKRCLALNKLLRNEELMYACGMEPIGKLIIKKKLKSLLMLYNNKTTKHIIMAMGDKLFLNNAGLKPSIYKKSTVYECVILAEVNYSNKHNLFNEIKESVATLNLEKEIMSESEIVQEVAALLDRPSLENWKQINDLLIPAQIEHLQEAFWGRVLGRQLIITENEVEGTDDFSLSIEPG
jgi:hypothetical protein